MISVEFLTQNKAGLNDLAGNFRNCEARARSRSRLSAPKMPAAQSGRGFVRRRGRESTSTVQHLLSQSIIYLLKPPSNSWRSLWPA